LNNIISEITKMKPNVIMILLSTDILSSWSNIDEESTSSADCLAADCRRDTSFDDFNLESSERVEIAEMFHGCENVARPAKRSLLDTSASTMTALPVSVPTVGGDERDEGVWSATSDVEMSSSMGQHHHTGVVAGGRWSSTSTNKYNPSNVVGRLQSDLATRKRSLERQRPHSVAQEVLRDWNDEEEDLEHRSVAAGAATTTEARDECTSADFERWLLETERGEGSRGDGRVLSHLPWSCSVDSGQSSVGSSCSSLDRLPFTSQMSSGIVCDVGPSTRSAVDVSGRIRRSLPIIGHGGEDEFLFETPYESGRQFSLDSRESGHPGSASVQYIQSGLT